VRVAAFDLNLAFLPDGCGNRGQSHNRCRRNVEFLIESTSRCPGQWSARLLASLVAYLAADQHRRDVAGVLEGVTVEERDVGVFAGSE
jgi:hypothetical protein